MTASDRLREARTKAGFSYASEASNRHGWNQVTYRSHENGTRAFDPDVARKYARAFGVKPEWLLYGKTSGKNEIPIVAYVGAGAEFHFYDDHERGGGLDTVEAPPGVNEKSIAVMVRGQSMFPAYYDGDLLFYSEKRDDIEHFLHRQCVIRLADGRTLVKTPTLGSKQGLFTLTSFNAEPIVDVVIEWCAKIEWIKRR